MKNFIRIFAILALISIVSGFVPNNPGFLADTLRGLINNCTLVCPSKAAPVPNPTYQKSFNGCGSKGFVVDPKLLPRPQFEQCCNNHDYCYDTCNIQKNDCDTTFWNCMLIACGNAVNCDTKICKANADAFYNIVKQIGCSSYLDSQRKACICN